MARLTSCPGCRAPIHRIVDVGLTWHVDATPIDPTTDLLTYPEPWSLWALMPVWGWCNSPIKHTHPIHSTHKCPTLESK